MGRCTPLCGSHTHTLLAAMLRVTESVWDALCELVTTCLPGRAPHPHAVLSAQTRHHVWTCKVRARALFWERPRSAVFGSRPVILRGQSSARRNYFWWWLRAIWDSRHRMQIGHVQGKTPTRRTIALASGPQYLHKGFPKPASSQHTPKMKRFLGTEP